MILAHYKAVWFSFNKRNLSIWFTTLVNYYKLELATLVTEITPSDVRVQ